MFQKARYPHNWPDLARAAKEAAQWRCVSCGYEHGKIVFSQRLTEYRVIVSACHLDHDTENPAPRLAVFCQACHLRYDAYQRWRSRRRHQVERQIAIGQLVWLDAPAHAVE